MADCVVTLHMRKVIDSFGGANSNAYTAFSRFTRVWIHVQLIVQAVQFKDI